MIKQVPVLAIFVRVIALIVWYMSAFCDTVTFIVTEGRQATVLYYVEILCSRQPQKDLFVHTRVSS